MAFGVYPGTFDPLTIAHLAVADAAIDQLGLTRLDLAISRRALGKEHLDDDTVDRRVAEISATIGHRPHLAVVVVDARLLADIARGYDAVVMGADKWAQVIDPAWYDGDADARDAAVAALPRVAVAPRRGWTTPSEFRLSVPDHIAEVSATAVRDGRHDWAASPPPDGAG